VTIVTGDVKGAGIRDPVQLQLEGERLIGEHILDEENAFLRSNVAKFLIQGQYGKLTDIKIKQSKIPLGAANTSLSKSTQWNEDLRNEWYLSKLFVCYSLPYSDGTLKPHYETWSYNTNWIDDSLDYVKLIKDEKFTVYQINIETGDQPGSGTNSDITIKLYYDSKTFLEKQLKYSSVHEIPFKTAQKDQFIIEGKVEITRVTLTSSNAKDSWCIANLEIINLANQKLYQFSPSPAEQPKQQRIWAWVPRQ